jgi:hypothetical protein
MSRGATVMLALGATSYYSISLVKTSTGGGQWATWGKVVVFGILILTGAWALFTAPSGTIEAGMLPFLPRGTGGLLQAMGFTFIALQGFDLIAAIAGEVKRPEETIPKAMLLSLGAALVIYLPLLFIVSTVGVPLGQSIQQISEDNPETAMAVAVGNFLGPTGFWLVAVAAVLSTLSALHANVLAASRVALTMARDRTLPVFLEQLHAVRGTPVIAIYASALAIVAIVLMIPDVSAAGAAASLIFLVSFALAHWTGILARIRRRGEPAPFQTPWFPLIPVTGGLACVLMAVFQGFAVPAAGAITVFWLGLGVLLYLGLFSGRARAFDAFSEANDPDLVRFRGRSPLVLVPTANPDNAPSLVALAAAIAPPLVGRVLLLTVITPRSETEDSLEGLHRAQSVLERALATSLRSGYRPEALMTIASGPWDEIARVARTHACEGLLLGRATLENVAGGPLETLLDSVSCDVAFLRSPPGWKLDDVKRILVPVARGQGGHYTMRARLLGSLCRTKAREVIWLRVVPSETNPSQQAEARKELNRLASDTTPGISEVVIVTSDDVAGAVAEHAARCDLVLLGLTLTATGDRTFGELAPTIAARTDRATIMISQAG